MRNQFLAVVSALSAVALAQSYNQLPDCAKACVGDSLKESGCSNIGAECVCENDGLVAALACCVGKSCPDKKEQDDARTFANLICAPYSVTLPAAATCASGVSIINPTGGTASPTSAAASATGSSPTVTSAGAQETGASSTGAAAAPCPTAGIAVGAAVVGALAML